MTEANASTQRANSRSTHLDNDHVWRLTTNLLDLQKSGKFCDVQLLCLDGTLMAHSAVLVSASNTLQATIQHQHMHLPMMEYTIETVQRLVSYLYTGRIEHPPPHDMVSFQNLMDSMGLPYTPGSEDGTATEDEVPEMEQDIKPQLSQTNGNSVSSFQLVNSKLDFEEETPDSENDAEEINIKEEIDPDEPSTSEVPDVITPASRRGRKRKSYIDEFDDYDEDYTPVKRSTARKRTSAKRGRGARAKAVSPRSKYPVKSATNTSSAMLASGESENDNEQFNIETQEEAEVREEDAEDDETAEGDQKTKKKSNSRTVQCKYCDETTDDIVNHMDTMHSEVKRKSRVRYCTQCDYRSHQKVGFLYHMMTKHDDNSFGTVPIYRCEDCDFQTCFSCIYQKHRRQVHEKIKEFRCRICGAAYTEKRNLEAHKSKHEETRDEAKQRKVRVCPICGYIGYHRSPFVYHMIQKHNDMSYGTVEMHKCDLCNFQSCYLPTVKKHKKTVHEKVKDFTCSICQLEFSSRAAMRTHKKMHDVKRSKSVCEICGQSMLDVKSHILRMHSGAEPKPKPVQKTYVCPACGWQTKDTSYFKFHMITRHNDTSYGTVKIYKCDHCDYENYSKHTMWKHNKRVHEKVKDHQCEICGRSVTTKSALIGHRLTHSEEGRTSLQCPHCTYATCWPNVLSRHIDRKHTVKNLRWPCTLCPTLLKEKDVLQLHLKKKHGLSNEDAKAAAKTVQGVPGY